ncbi:hypothetical protein C5F49_06820 [Nitrosopumilus oxyclinae]|uniref:DUF432 domain-containing protein n=1 Tax=Nitrosopumilus oxyclinae TaxID=1959104 RepID=A0A7D5RB67_9ARCH|nr:DUF432 domain-containing protein [Nitrosopumilus oxyclinae]QLH05061.1 hypothetical protein C5F49_06820 [Nitrosopumilus oxyclinae]
MSKEENFSGYGMYDVSDKLDLVLPKTEIHITRKLDGRLSYYRKNSTSQEIRKSIQQSNKDTKIELCPVLPLHLPAKKTNDLIFLRLEESLFVEKNSTVNVLIQFPIEIGIFVINSSDNSKELFDCFTCEPMHSRFALYGTPEKGNLCMYSKVKLLENNESNPYVFAKMKVTLSNELSQGAFVGKIVFPITSHVIYYRDNSHEVHIDDVKCVIKQDVGKDIIEIDREDYSTKEENLNIVSYAVKKEKSSFMMDKGFD